MSKEVSKVCVEESLKKIRTNLLYCEGKVFAFTSCSANAGKTTTTLNIANQLAILGKKVVVIDGDLKKPSIKKVLKLNDENPSGLSEFLSGQNELKIVTSNKFQAVLSGKVPPNSSELLSSRKFSSLLEKLKEEYDYVLIDTPPVSGTIDAQIIGERVDGVVLVIKANCDKEEQLKNIVKDFKNKNIKIVGSVLNMVKKDDEGYYNYYY